MRERGGEGGEAKEKGGGGRTGEERSKARRRGGQVRGRGEEERDGR